MKMLSHQSSPRVLLSDLEYLTLKIAFNPGCSALWYLEQLRKYAGAGSMARGGEVYDFISGQLVTFTPGPSARLRALLARALGRGYVLTDVGLDIARDAAVKVGIDPDTIPW
jgi:hypothetical protein